MVLRVHSGWEHHELYSQQGLGYLASVLSKPLYTDRSTAMKLNLEYAKVCVEVLATYDLPSSITVDLRNSTYVDVGVQLDWAPPCCSSCSVFGHATDKCRKTIVHEDRQQEIDVVSTIVVDSGDVGLCVRDEGVPSSNHGGVLSPNKFDALCDVVEEQIQVGTMRPCRVITCCLQRGDESCVCSFVYAGNGREDRVDLWRDLVAIKPKQKRNTVHCLYNRQGQKLESNEEISAELVDYFSSTLGVRDDRVHVVSDSLLKEILGNELDNYSRNALLAPVSRDEIKVVMFGKDVECCSTQLIDGDGTFNVTGIEQFIKEVKLGECGLSYAVVSIMGPQSSGTLS
ncbi:hypothetical protein V6N13_093912 [Hibiscus sabdariffa]